MADQHVFFISIVPLEVLLGSHILWKNPRPSSTRYCRPLKILFAKESTELVKVEIQNIQAQILEIVPTRLSRFQVDHKLQLTMIDGKVFSVIAETSSQICGICKATPKLMNDVDAICRLPKNDDLFKYGLSTMHSWIRCFECVLHISYRLPIKKWQVRGSDKSIVDQRKATIQDRFRVEMALFLDIPM